MKYTIFCRESSGTGTTWIESVEADDPEQAKQLGLKLCASDWGWGGTNDIAVIGVATGDIEIVEWDDSI